MFSTDVYYNNVNLNGFTGVTIYNYESIGLPDKALSIHKIARADHSILTSAEYTTKEIVVHGMLCGATKDETDQIYDSLKAVLQPPNKELSVSQSNTSIIWTATLHSIDIRWFGKKLIFDLIFTASDPIGTDLENTTLVNISSITTSSHTEGVNIEGSAKARPLFVYTLSAVSGGTGATVTISNAISGQGIVVTRTWTAGDIMDINSDTKEVTVNGIAVDYSGSFPDFYPGSQSIDCVDSFTTRTYSLLVTYYRKYS